MPEARVADGAWRGIDELAALVGAYCWVENRIFEITGAWASAAGADDVLAPALRVWSAGVSRRHGLLAARWAERLPVRAGVDASALAAPPGEPLAGALDTVASGPAAAGVALLIHTVLPSLQGVYAAHARAASPVSEGPVSEVLAAAHRAAAGEINRGRHLLDGSAEGLTRDAALGAAIERAFNAKSVFPAVHAS